MKTIYLVLKTIFNKLHTHNFNCWNKKILRTNEQFNNLNIYQSFYVKIDHNTIKLKTDTNNVNDIYNNLLCQVKIITPY